MSERPSAPEDDDPRREEAGSPTDGPNPAGVEPRTDDGPAERAGGGDDTGAAGAAGEAGGPSSSPAQAGHGDDADDAGPPRRGHPGWLILALLLALAAAGGAGYLGWRLHQLEQRVAAIPGERAAAIEPLARRAALQRLERRLDERLQAALRAKAEELATARQQGLEALRKRMATLEQGVREVRELAARDQVGWRLAEIRYLLAIAQRRLLIARDTRSAIAALESADRAIAELGSVRLLPLREHIVDHLAALRAVEPADVEGIALRLQNLLGRVAALPIASADDEAGRTGPEAGDGGGWWARVTEGLDRFVHVRRRDVGPDRGRPEPTSGLPESDRLVLALERARQAALARNPDAFERWLGQAEQALEAGFRDEADATQRFRAALTELRGRRVVAELPTLDETLALARRLSARLEAENRTRDGAAEEQPAAADGGTGEDGRRGPGPAAASGSNGPDTETGQGD